LARPIAISRSPGFVNISSAVIQLSPITPSF
jgi:hypothetical protein